MTDQTESRPLVAQEKDRIRKLEQMQENQDGKMEWKCLTLQRSRDRLTRSLVSWQMWAIGLLALALAVNMAQWAWIASLEAGWQVDAERYRAQIESAEHTRDLAVEQLGEMVLQAEADKQAQAELAAAYEMIGEYQYIGECTVTAYCPCAECCGRWADGFTATGLPAGPGIVAVDPEVIPLGSTVIIDGQKYLAADTGVTGKHVDVCLPEHEETVAFGVQTTKVWVEEETSNETD